LASASGASAVVDEYSTRLSIRRLFGHFRQISMKPMEINRFGKRVIERSATPE
jgi:hypothetical protein